MKPTLLWFRRDLRLRDNPALDWAVRRGAPIVPIYIHSPEEEAPWAPGGASRWWLHHSLRSLAAGLARLGLTLRCFRGHAGEILPQLVRSEDAGAVAGNRLYELRLARRDAELTAGLGRDGVDTAFFDSALLFPPDALHNRQGKPYRVFTPFWRSARQTLEQAPPGAALTLPARPLPATALQASALDVDGLGLLDRHPWQQKLLRHWQPGEDGAHDRLESFLASALERYEPERQFPARHGSSRLSPYLHFGEITPAQVVRALRPALDQWRGSALEAVERFLAEIGWREFAHHVLWHFPESDRQSLNPRFAEGFWAWDSPALAAWQRGETGIPLVDAGMRELWETGWMHNRVRMVVGSLLTKNLGIHWLVGARWFWDTLVDADLANNSLGWQWIAGCGVDAAPYFRIFNPETQAEKFDPQGNYVRRWLGDRRALKPIVDLKESRRQALERYRHLSA